MKEYTVCVIKHTCLSCTLADNGVLFVIYCSKFDCACCCVFDFSTLARGIGEGWDKKKRPHV